MNTERLATTTIRGALLAALALLLCAVILAGITQPAAASVTETTTETEPPEGPASDEPGTSGDTGEPIAAMTCAELVDKHRLSLNLASYWSTRPGNQGYVNKFLDYAADYLSEAKGKGCFSAA